jgi:hypothetical protein
MQEPSIALSPSMTEYFRGVVDEAIRQRRVEATDAAVSYVVGLLCSYARPDNDAATALSQPFTFLLRDAMAASGSERFHRLRTLGDGVLYTAGFFGEHVAHKGIDLRYVLSVGRSAYDGAAAMLHLGRKPLDAPDVLGELSKKFERFVEVLGDVADGTMASASQSPESVVQLYERWLRTGSMRLAEELGALGLMPSRGAGGTH